MTECCVVDQAVLFPPSHKTQKIAGLEIRVPRDHHLAHSPVIQNLTVYVLMERIRLLHQAFQFQRKRAVHIRPCLVCKNFQDFPSHRIFVHMHGALNIDENKN